jgi:copper transport protein
VLVVMVAIAIAAWNRFVLLPRLRAADRQAERDDAAAPVVRTTFAEAGVLVVVLLLTGFLVDRSPEPTVAVEPDSSATGTDTVQLDDISAEVTLEPLGVGPAALTLTMTDEAGEPAEGYEAPRMSLSTDGVDLGAVSLTNLGPGIYSGDVVLPTAGSWEVQVSLRTTEFDNPVRTVTFRVP